MTEKDLYTITMQNTLNELQKACLDIRYAFIFRATGEIVARNQETEDKTIIRAFDSLNSIMGKAEAIGGIESVTLRCSGGTMVLQNFDEHYFVAITAVNADINYIKTLTHIVISTVTQLLEKVSPTPLKNIGFTRQLPPHLHETQPETLTVKEEAAEKPEEKPEPGATFEPVAIQLIVENVGGFLAKGPLAHSDTVRIDKETLARWKNMLERKEIEYVEIETINGKTTKCKVKPIKDSKYFGKGIVQIPEKMQSLLEIKKGELVKVKPIMD